MPERAAVGGFSCGDRVKESLGVHGAVDFESEVPVGFSAGASGERIDRKLFEWFFCMVHCGFEPRSATDMDHADPYEHIRANQQRLMAFLNENREFAIQLIAQPGMNEYFREHQGTIQASSYFFAKGYNAIDNLWLLCHVCNLNKSASDPVQWFGKKTAFGKAFLAALAAAGSLHPGVLIGRVYQESAEELRFVTGDGVGVSLHVEEAEELGTFVTRWFMENRGETYEAVEKFNGRYIEFFRRALAMVVSEKDLQQSKVIARRLRSGIDLLIPPFQAVTVAVGDAVSDSGSDFSGICALKGKVGDSVREYITDGMASLSELKKIRHYLELVFPDEYVYVWEEMARYLETCELDDISSRELYDLRMRICLAIDDYSDLSEDAPDIDLVEEIKQIIDAFIGLKGDQSLGFKGSLSDDDVLGVVAGLEDERDIGGSSSDSSVLEGKPQRKRADHRRARLSSSPHKLFRGGVPKSKSERLHGVGRRLAGSAQNINQIAQSTEEPSKAQLEAESEVLRQLAHEIMRETAEVDRAAASADGFQKGGDAEKPQGGEVDPASGLL